jgi:phosphoribosylformylglycinamidine cyclo-ligase
VPKDSWTYKDAGVDIRAGAEAVDAIKELVKKTNRPGVLSGIGGFGGLFEIEPGRYREPVLVSSTDGVGTKVKIAQDTGIHDTVGIDLVAMCVNDIIVMGAEPLFFLDYIACGRLDVSLVNDLVKGISEGCAAAGCALLGGETAEMPDLYRDGEYDLAGFTVGVVEKSKIIDGTKIAPGDVVIGLPSSGVHSNGYSLVRKLFPNPDKKLAQELLTSTTIYVKSVLRLLKDIDAHGLAHITGGGLIDNVARILPDNTAAVFDTSSWAAPDVFAKLQAKGNVGRTEMFTVFNMGIGMTIVVAESDLDPAREILDDVCQPYEIIGTIQPGHGNVVINP